MERGPERQPDRRRELDAVRALVVVGLVLFHAALVFDARDDFYVKNAETTELTTFVAAPAVVCAMPLLFAIAGIGAWHSVRSRGPGGFVRERLLRIGVPLLVALVLLLPLPQFLRARVEGTWTGSYLAFWPRFFDVRLEPGDVPFVLDGEHFETGHLWFLVLLLTWALVLAALVRLVPDDVARRTRERLARRAGARGAVLAPAVVVGAVCAAHELEEGLAAWSRWGYLLFFLAGFVLASDARFRAAVRRDAVLAGTVGLGAFAAGMLLFVGPAGEVGAFTGRGPAAVSFRFLYGVAGWCWVLALLGLLDRWGARRSAHRGDGVAVGPRWRRAGAYLGAAVLPLYVLHQPVVVAVAYPVVTWDLPAAAKYAVIVVVSLGVLLAVYDVLVRRTRVARVLFGMRA
ncbi:acyltransferase [Cellulosimicrobium cellulans]|uniref:acyltransferase family protein n=1 Tax=Cellulosimicrobium cellulans TaxID=1710 RepID=UPI0019663213|nr:acyltransferase [Cellulosimicrobium cellulans]MBN0040888.1 acyltransferase [Cellulosimicrobium cellulans]